MNKPLGLVQPPSPTLNLVAAAANNNNDNNNGSWHPLGAYSVQGTVLGSFSASLCWFFTAPL